ncbi:hypothetical protein P153DRAFT_285819 [Dothidotthia symphoricarpi CBS 119687]|uniref:C2H2-type domain-containing protein n=1 Tax=Dothidotthia symphoricarpi CBS 119687 TaxID=1392245 RepID=A0A6A6AK64_9PLEO|nr:uncharacterized protein P153DRAFT_285819 [Dothidotthia symphoricarpi CBS 119687]KAF2132210.1 hypothetical protein P153DRAFT_285819 [Dothidotthia symphoricarpi CBS 119687]
MGPNHPEIAQQVSERALNSDSGSEDEEEMEGQSPTTGSASQAQSAISDASRMEPQHIAQEGLKIHLADDSMSPPNHLFHHRDSGVDAGDIKRSMIAADRRASHASSASSIRTGIRIEATRTGSITLACSPPSTLVAPSSNPPSQQHGPITNEYSHEDLSRTLRQLTIPAPSSDKLPALQTTRLSSREGSAASPNHQQLPSFQQIDNMARSTISDQEAQRTTEFRHRQSISSMGHSPTSVARQLSISSLSPASPFPPFPVTLSPVSASSESQKRDVFLTSGHLTLFSPGLRRPSQASDLHSASSPSDSYHSPEGLSPGALQNPGDNRTRHMSMDGALSRQLPPPHRSSIPHFGSPTGSFVCKYSGCTAAPFQTQYLLNSHANVHSQSRPHYCPVDGCPRSEGGKGFKRKNEMIRHGLVHQSPGYVCPFCPDREHKYPRPDNLQRHVRVHHVDRDKDDPKLREVLAQRVEGGSRGRRRRVC